jgi:hypothetical protein
MDMVLEICVSDGSGIIIDGFDEISFYNDLPNVEITHSGYSWQRDFYYELLNNLSKYKFIGVNRKDPNDELKYRNYSYAFKNSHFEGNRPLLLQTNCITTIVDMYK